VSALFTELAEGAILLAGRQAFATATRAAGSPAAAATERTATTFIIVVIFIL
jgi:hypothetical protein